MLLQPQTAAEGDDTKRERELASEEAAVVGEMRWSWHFPRGGITQGGETGAPRGPKIILVEQ
jgi:hypothetical protein